MGLVAVYAGILVFVAASFFFALAESSLFALTRWQIRQLTERAPGKGAIVGRLMERPSELLATIVLGNTVANGAIVALVLWPALVGRWSVTVSVVTAVLLVLLICEVLPKTLAVRAPEEWALRVARPVLVLQGSTGWLQRLVHDVASYFMSWFVPKTGRAPTTLTDEEYQELLDLAYQQGTLARSEKEIILQIISLDRKTAKDVMKPLSQMKAISDDLSVEEMIEAARKFKHRRIPIYDETPDTIVGILNTEALLLDPRNMVQNEAFRPL